MELDKKNIGNRIKSIRLSLGDNMREFGERIGHQLGLSKEESPSDSIVSRWEKGVSLPNPERLKAIAELVDNMTVNDLLYGGVEEYVSKVVNKYTISRNKEIDKEALNKTINFYKDFPLPYGEDEEIENTYRDATFGTDIVDQEIRLRDLYNEMIEKFNNRELESTHYYILVDMLELLKNLTIKIQNRLIEYSEARDKGDYIDIKVGDITLSKEDKEAIIDFLNHTNN